MPKSRRSWTNWDILGLAVIVPPATFVVMVWAGAIYAKAYRDKLGVSSPWSERQPWEYAIISPDLTLFVLGVLVGVPIISYVHTKTVAANKGFLRYFTVAISVIVFCVCAAILAFVGAFSDFLDARGMWGLFGILLLWLPP